MDSGSQFDRPQQRGRGRGAKPVARQGEKGEKIWKGGRIVCFAAGDSGRYGDQSHNPDNSSRKRFKTRPLAR